MARVFTFHRGSPRTTNGLAVPALGASALRVSSLVLLLGFAGLSPRGARAQAIRGVVVDDNSLTPVPGAMVRLVRGNGPGLGTETDDEGRFLLPVDAGVEYRLQVGRLGYETALSRELAVESGDTLSVEFRVLPDAVLLDPITVVAHSRRGRDAFDRRRVDWDRGFFISPAMVDSVSPRYPAELLKGLDKVDVRWGWGVSSSGMPGPMPSVRTVLGRGCMLYMVDFVPVRPEPWARGDWAGYQLSSLAGDDIVAVEVYRSVLEVPPELRQYTNQSSTTWSLQSYRPLQQDKIHCGLTVFWTRAGW